MPNDESETWAGVRGRVARASERPNAAELRELAEALERLASASEGTPRAPKTGSRLMPYATRVEGPVAERRNAT